jgi:hypothetical protein
MEKPVPRHDAREIAELEYYYGQQCRDCGLQEAKLQGFGKIDGRDNERQRQNPIDVETQSEE